MLVGMVMPIRPRISFSPETQKPPKSTAVFLYLKKPKMLKSFTTDDFKLEWFSGTGAGGQHRNKHQNCLRLTHIETGLIVTSQSHRSRIQNRKEAFQKMADLLRDHYNPVTKKERLTEVIRSYKLEDNLVVDHKTGHKYVIQGMDSIDLNEIISKKG